MPKPRTTIWVSIGAQSKRNTKTNKIYRIAILQHNGTQTNKLLASDLLIHNTNFKMIQQNYTLIQPKTIAEKKKNIKTQVSQNPFNRKRKYKTANPFENNFQFIVDTHTQQRFSQLNSIKIKQKKKQVAFQSKNPERKTIEREGKRNHKILLLSQEAQKKKRHMTKQQKKTAQNIGSRTKPTTPAHFAIDSQNQTKNIVTYNNAFNNVYSFNYNKIITYLTQKKTKQKKIIMDNKKNIIKKNKIVT